MKAAAVSAPSAHDLEACLQRIEGLCRQARYDDVDLLVLPGGAVGGFPGPRDGIRCPPPTPLDLDGREVQRLCSLAGGVVVVVGVTELASDGSRHETVLCLSGDGVLGEQRRVHRHPVDLDVPAPRAFDTPVGRLGLLVGYDKAFPEAARSLARDGAEVLCSAAAWTGEVGVLDAYDTARAAENQVFVVSAGQCGHVGDRPLCGRAKVVGPSGRVLAVTGDGPGTAVAELDLQEVVRARRSNDHLAAFRAAPVPA